MNLKLVIRYLGFGKRCSGCGRVRETTSYEIRQGEKRLQGFLLCDACQDRGHIVRFQLKEPSTVTPTDRRKRIKISRKLEQGVAKDIGGRTTPGSGNKNVKAEVRKIDEWRLEHKYTDNPKGYTLKVEELGALVRHANLAGEWPGLVVDFRKVNRKFVTIPYELFLAIVERLRD
jgi:hypothetical protein